MKVLSRKWWLLNSFLFFLIVGNIKAQSFQNIVPNGSFETYTQCPTNGSEIYFAPPWTGPKANSTDYFNSCATILNVPYYCGIGNTYPCYLAAKNGSGYIGMYNYQLNNFREYAQVKLSDTLNGGICYYVEFYAANCQYRKYRINNIAAAFSPSAYGTSTSPPYLINLTQHITNYGNPVLQDTATWQKISGLYEPTGNEAYILLGNFKDDSNTDTVNIYPVGKVPYYGPSHSYIFIDAVSVYSLDPHGTLPWSYRDTIINEWDSVFIGNKMGGLNFHPKWYKEDGTFITTNGGITVKPQTTSEYIVQFTLCGVAHTDTLKVTVIPKNGVGIDELRKWSSALKIYPQPASDVLNFENELIGDGETMSIRINNSFAQVIRQEEIVFRNKKAKMKIDDLPNGVYFVSFKTKTNESIVKKMVVSK